MASLNELLPFIGAPLRTPPPIDWGRLRERTGLQFPGDYMELCGRYPQLRVDNFLGIFHPVEDAEGENLLSWAEEILGAAADLSEEFPDLRLVPFPLYPAEGGLFPWGVTDNGDHLFWRTRGEPDRWTVVVAGHSYAEGDWWEFNGSMTEFLAGVLTREVICPVLPSDFPSESAGIEQDLLP